MNRILFFVLGLAFALGLRAQEMTADPLADSARVRVSETEKALGHVPDAMPLRKVDAPLSGDAYGSRLQPVDRFRRSAPKTVSPDTLHLPALTQNGQMPSINMYPHARDGYPSWQLHQGLNVSMEAGVFAAFGKGAPRGAGFFQSLSAMYAVPLGDKLSLAVGGYFNNVVWDNMNFRSAGVNAVLGYRFNDKWEAYVYAQKSFTNHLPARFRYAYGSPCMYPLYDMTDIGDRIGASVKYNVNPSFSIQVSVEKRDFPAWDPMGFGQ
ncbi:MAG: hypothetical protein PUH24_07900 [Prevotellaceae bacterium]|nr:hypothetical protein [Prevotellaceae bacterium]